MKKYFSSFLISLLLLSTVSARTPRNTFNLTLSLINQTIPSFIKDRTTYASTSDALTPAPTGPPTIRTISIIGSTVSGKTFTITAGAVAGDPLTKFSLKKGPYTSKYPWTTKPCNGNICNVSWNLLEQTPGTYNYILEITNTYGDTDTKTIPVTITNQPTASTYTFTTAAIDGKLYDTTKTTTYLPNTLISITDTTTSASAMGNPYATFTVNANTPPEKQPTKNKDTSLTINTSSSTHGFPNALNFNALLFKERDKPPVLHKELPTNAPTNTATNYNIHYTYIPFDPKIGSNVIKLLNPLYTTTAPVLNFQGKKIIFTEDQGIAQFDLTPFVIDADTPISALTWSVTLPHHFNATFHDNILIITPLDHTFLGSEALHILVTDPQGNSDTDTLLVQLLPSQNSPPTFTTTTPETPFIRILLKSFFGVFGNQTFSMYATDREADTLTYQWFVDNTPVATNTLHYTFTPISFLPGLDHDQNFTITARVSDGTHTINRNWTVAALTKLENDPPSVTNFQISPQLINQRDPVFLSATVHDASGVKSVAARITYPDGTTTITTLTQSNDNTYTATFHDTTAKGTYSVTLLAMDIYNNLNDNYTTTFTVDDTPPSVQQVTIQPPIQNRTNSVLISATVTDNLIVNDVTAYITYPDGSILTFPMTQGPQNIYTLSFSDTTHTGIYTLRIVAIDKSNNINDHERRFFTIQDVTPPSITNVTITPPEQWWSLPVQLNFSVNDDVAVQAVNATLTAPDHTLQELSLQTLDNIHYNILYTNTFLFGTYFLTLTATDTSGNIQTFQTNFTINQDTISPQINTVQITPPIQIRLNPVTVTASITDNVAVQNVNLQILFPNLTQQLFPMTFTRNLYTITIPGPTLSLIGRYTATLLALDTSNNLNETTVAFTIIDTIPPTITNVTITPAEQWQSLPISISANAFDDVALQNVQITFQDPDGRNQTFSNLSSTNTFYNLPYANTTKSGTYTITINATDTSGNSQLAVKTFFIKADTEKPAITIISPLNNSQVKPLFTINYTATDNTQVQSCSYHLDNSAETLLPDCNPFTLTIPTIGPHILYLSAQDINKNIGTTPLTVTIIDTIPPNITSFTIQPATITDNINTTFSVNATDNVAVQQVQAHVTYPDTTQKTFTMLDTTGSGTYSLNFSDTHQRGVYIITAIATDLVGNTNTSTSTFTVIQDTTNPTVTIFNPQANAFLKQTSIPIQFAATDNIGVQSCTYFLDSGTETSIPSCANFSLSMGSGNHTLTIKAQDYSTNTGSTSVTFSTDITGKIIGVTRSTQGNTLLPGVLIEILSQNTGQVVQSLTSDSNGAFSLIIDSGSYDIRLSKTGYITRTLPNVDINVGQTRMLTFYITPSS